MRSVSDIDPRVVAVCVSNGGVPKRALEAGTVTKAGIEGDGHAHAKHIRPERAISILDIEVMRDLHEEGFPLQPGTAGENLTVEGLHVQQMQPGMLLEIGDVTLRLEEPRKPCFVLDVIHPALKEAIVGRCGYMASVVRGGTIRPGMHVARAGDHATAITQLESNNGKSKHVVSRLRPAASANARRVTTRRQS